MRLEQLQTFRAIAVFDQICLSRHPTAKFNTIELQKIKLTTYCAAANFAKDSATATDNSEV